MGDLMTERFFDDLFLSLAGPYSTIPAGLPDLSEKAFMDCLFAGGTSRRDLAAQITPMIRNRWEAICPLPEGTITKEVVDLNQPGDIPISDPDSIFYFVDSMGVRIFFHEGSLPIRIFNLDRRISIHLKDLREGRTNAVQIAMAEGLLILAAKEKARINALISCSHLRPYQFYRIIHSDLTVLSYDEPKDRTVGFSLWKEIGLGISFSNPESSPPDSGTGEGGENVSVES